MKIVISETVDAEVYFKRRPLRLTSWKRLRSKLHLSGITGGAAEVGVGKTAADSREDRSLGRLSAVTP